HSKDVHYLYRTFSERLGLRLLVPPKELLFLVQNLYTATYALVCYPLWPVAFRGHGFSLLALAKGMSTLLAMNGFSRPSLKYCGVFRHVLRLRLLVPSKTVVPAGVNWPSLQTTLTKVKRNCLI